MQMVRNSNYKCSSNLGYWWKLQQVKIIDICAMILSVPTFLIIFSRASHTFFYAGVHFQLGFKMVCPFSPLSLQCVKATVGLQVGCACEGWLSWTSHALSDQIFPNKVTPDYLMSDQGLWHSKGCKLSQRRHSSYNIVTINSQMNIRAIEL